MKNQILGFAAAAAVLMLLAVPGHAQKKPTGKPVALPTMPMGQLQEVVRNAVDKISPAVVGLRMSNGSSGSGVMVGEDGLIMTAAHVTHPPGNGVQIQVMFPDGRKAKVEKRGAYYAQDAAFAQITEKGKRWPYVEYADANPKVGDWVIALGHTAGFDLNRTPPVRVGQVLAVPKGNSQGYIVTDCSMAGGDSGGPLFNLDGKVIGIHSSIGRSLRQNLHVPIQVYQTHWERMVSGEEWGRGGGAVLGVRIAPKGEDKKPGAVIDQIFPNSAAEKAGLEPGDRILKFAGKDVADGDGLVKLLRGFGPGDKVEVEVERPVDQDVNPAAEVDPEAEPEMETVKLEVEFPGTKKKKKKTSDDAPTDMEAKTTPIQFDLGNLRRPGSRPGRTSADVGIFTRPASNGLGVSDVVNGSPAEKAGLHRGDLIVKVDGVPMTSADDLARRFEAAKPGDTITVSVRRGGKDVDLKIKLPKVDRPEGDGPKRIEKDPNALRDMLAKLREGKVDPEEVRKMFAGRIPDLNVAPGYKPIQPRGEGPTLDQFKPVASSVRRSVVEMIAGYKSVGLGTVVGDGFVLTKASELDEKEKLRAEMPSGVWADAKVVKTFKKWDLALVEIDSDESLEPVDFKVGDEYSSVGTLITAFGNSVDSLGWGVVGVSSRSMEPKIRGFLGVQVKAEEGGGVKIEKVVKDSAAEKSGLKVGDLIRKAKDQAVKDPRGFTMLIGNCKPGEEILFEILRGKEEKSVVAKLGERKEKEMTAPPVSNTSRMGTKLSEHRYGYPSAMQHDLPLAPNQMGGPLVSFDGNVIGLNIARAGRTKTFAIPADAVLKLLEKEDLN